MELRCSTVITCTFVLFSTIASTSGMTALEAYVNSPDEEDLYDYLYEDGGPPQEEEDDIRRAVQERYMEKYKKEMESGSRPRYFLFTIPAAPGYSMALPNSLGRDENGVDVFRLREQRAALRRSGGRFRIWGGAQTDFGHGTPAYGSLNREELNKVGNGRYYAPGSGDAKELQEKWRKRRERRQKSRERRLRRNRKRDRASKYGYQGSKNQAEILLSGIRGVNDVFHKVFTG